MVLSKRTRASALKHAEVVEKLARTLEELLEQGEGEDSKSVEKWDRDYKAEYSKLLKWYEKDVWPQMQHLLQLEQGYEDWAAGPDSMNLWFGPEWSANQFEDAIEPGEYDLEDYPDEMMNFAQKIAELADPPQLPGSTRRRLAGYLEHLKDQLQVGRMRMD